jgi:D-arabinitol dehydrogenase (NADP+)
MYEKPTLSTFRTATHYSQPAGKVFKIHNLSDVDATLLEPASCAAHGLDKISPKLGSSVLMFGAGPTGLVLSQMLRQNGGCHVVVAAPQGLKMELAKKLGAGDVYVELSRENPEVQFQKLKDENPYGFDIVVEATGSPKILEDAINYVRRGGKVTAIRNPFLRKINANRAIMNSSLSMVFTRLPLVSLGHLARFSVTRSLF